MIRILILVVMLAGACNDKENNARPAAAPVTGGAVATTPPPAPPNLASGAFAPASPCATQTVELRAFLTAVFDPAQKVAAPWPTGDAAFDAELPKLRDVVREQAKPADPAIRHKPLSADITPGRLDEELASCLAATEQIKKVGEAKPDQRIATYVALADAIASCGCKPSIPRVRALVYLIYRGPD